MNGHTLNFLGEFADKNIEREFFNQDMEKAMKYIRPIILILAVLYTLFLIPDYYLIQDSASFRNIAVSRIILLTLILVLYSNTKKIRNYRLLSYWITAYEILSILVFLFIYYQYKSPDYLIQAFGVMVILLAVFMVPNRWISMVGVSIFAVAAFIMLSVFYIKGIALSKFSAGIVYILIVVILCGISSYRMNYHKRVQFDVSNELTRLSMIDTLSGAFNRAKFDDELKRWMEYSQRYNTPLSLIMLDFDDFKRINDSLGHLVGDSVIVECAKLMKNGIRESDIFARWGGEEFVILLPNTDMEQAVLLAERLRLRIEEHTFDKAGRVTCSFGAAQMRADDDIESLVQKADQMLYMAKNLGKNAVKGFPC